MRKFTFSLLALAFISGCAAPETKIEKSLLNDEYFRYTLSNGYFGVDVMPQLGGRISGMRSIPEQREFFREQRVSVEKDDLLPPVVRSNDTGITDYGWRKALCLKPAAVESVSCDPEVSSITMRDRYFRLLDCECVKKVSLRRQSSAMQVEITLSNRAAEPLEFSLWQNVLPVMGGEGNGLDIVVIPAKGKTDGSGSRRVTFFERDTVFQERDLAVQEIYVAPVRPWIAVRGASRPGVLVLRVADELAGNGAFCYTWKNSRTHTMEWIGKTMVIPPGGNHLFQLEYAYFPDMKNISDVFGKEVSSGVYAGIGEGKLRIEMQSSGKVESAEWKFFLTSAGTDGRRIPVGTVIVPELLPGKLFSVEFALPSGIAAGEYFLSGSSGRDDFRIPEAFCVK